MEKSNYTLTVFTPTYNRSYTLTKLYESLARQTSKDFEWIVVDDGSIDDTERLITRWKNEGIVPITYEYQQNSGKMKAHNRGVEMAKTELFMCVDSDDYISDDAVESIIHKWSQINNKDTLAGIIAYKSIRNKDGEYKVVCEFPHLGYDKLYMLYKNGFRGDTTLVFRTESIKPIPFPSFEGEKFIPENVMYDQLDLKYDWALMDKVLTLCEYMPDGYTQNGKTFYDENPKGMAFMYNEHAKMPKLTWREKILMAEGFIGYSKKAGYKRIYRMSTVKGILYVAAIALNFKNRKRK